ncbi:MAG: hypothetical protein IKE27_01470 [Oscillospiraceae bacterium]|jgi:hypothetical protein|nr:hypothetical protein [Oscillospiraceae bacterium]
MKPFREYDLSKVIANQWAAVNKKIDTMSNEEIMANDLDVLAENIYQEYFIEPVTIFEEDFSKRSIKQGKIQKYIDPFFRDYSDREYVEVDGVIAEFYFPYTGESDLFKCRASTFSMGVYPEITVNKTTVSFRIERSLSEMNNAKAKDSLLGSLEQALKEIRDGLSYANNDVAAFNNSLKQQAMKWLEEKKKKVEAYFSIATMFEVPIEKKEYAQTHIPLKRHIVPVAKHYETSNYYGILDGDYKDILDSIKHTGSTYERTPSSYKTLHEEDLRNTLLAALNATYKGDATGETFRNRGKTDICIERDNRAAFVAECKMWTGQKEIGNAIDQLDGYLTWRDCKTALIYFVRRKDFLKTLESAEAALRAYDGMRNVVSLDKNEFECLFLSKANPGQQIKMRVMLFNLYCED